MKKSQTWGTPKAWNPATLCAIGFTAAGSAGMRGTIYFDDIEFYSGDTPTPDPNVIIAKPKTNQLGYLPAVKKYFTVAANTASTNDTFRILDSGGNTAFTGTITGSPVDDRQVSGEYVFKVDFSALTVPGKYRVVVNGAESFNFNIAVSPRSSPSLLFFISVYLRHRWFLIVSFLYFSLFLHRRESASSAVSPHLLHFLICGFPRSFS